MISEDTRRRGDFTAPARFVRKSLVQQVTPEADRMNDYEPGSAIVPPRLARETPAA